MKSYRDIVIAGGGMVGTSLALQLAAVLPEQLSICGHALDEVGTRLAVCADCRAPTGAKLPPGVRESTGMG